MPTAAFLERHAKFFEQLDIDSDQLAIGNDTIIEEPHQWISEREIALGEGLFQNCKFGSIDDVIFENVFDDKAF